MGPVYCWLGQCARLFNRELVDRILNVIRSCNKVVHISDDSNSQYNWVIRNVFDKPPPIVGNNCQTILISGEPYDLSNDMSNLIISPCDIYTNVDKYLYHPFLYASLEEHRKSIDPVNYQVEKTKMCAFMYSVDYPHRVGIFDELSKLVKVDGLGKSRNNTNIASTRHINNQLETYNDIAVDMYKDYYFVLAIENCDKSGYFTEKVINPLIANSIPIYWGTDTIFNYLNRERILYLPDYTYETLVEKMNYLVNNPLEYQKMISLPWFREGKDIVNYNLELDKNLRDRILKLAESVK